MARLSACGLRRRHRVRTAVMMDAATLVMFPTGRKSDTVGVALLLAAYACLANVAAAAKVSDDRIVSVGD